MKKESRRGSWDEWRRRGEETAAAIGLPSRQVVLWWLLLLVVVVQFASSSRHPCTARYFFLTGPLGGVTGRPELRPPYWYLAFFSEGFKIWKEHMRVSSTDIMPPALSNSPQ